MLIAHQIIRSSNRAQHSLERAMVNTLSAHRSIVEVVSYRNVRRKQFSPNAYWFSRSNTCEKPRLGHPKKYVPSTHRLIVKAILFTLFYNIPFILNFSQQLLRPPIIWFHSKFSIHSIDLNNINSSIKHHFMIHLMFKPISQFH